MNAPDPPHWTLNSFFVCFALFGCIWNCLVAYKTRCKTGRSGAKVRAMKSFRNFSQRMHPIQPIGPYLMFQCVSYYLGAFGIVCCITTFSSKRAKLVQKFVPRSCVGISCNELTQFTPLNPRLMIFCVSYILDMFWTISLQHKTRCKTG